MSRYYSIIVTPIKGGKPMTWSSQPNGSYDPNALNVQFDVYQAQFAIPSPGTTITIEGPDFATLTQPSNFINSNIKLSAGMQKGLPLVTPSQAGVLIQGRIYQSFSNWTGDQMNISFVIIPGGNVIANPGNFLFLWKPGQMLSEAITNMLNIAYPGYRRQVTITDYPNTTKRAIVHSINTISQMSLWIQQHTRTVSNAGVGISLDPHNTLLISDGTQPQNAVQLQFIDLIGQPQWISSENASQQYVMQFMTVMRADLQVNSVVTMPLGIAYGPGSVTTTAGSNPLNQLKLKSAFQGPWTITAVRHVGNFRDSSGSSWSSVFQAVPAKVPT